MSQQWIARETPSLARRNADACGLARPDCPYRTACERDAESLVRARAGSRADFDALYDRAFALFYRTAGERLHSRALAEGLTRELMEGAFYAPTSPEGCASARLFRLVKRIGAKWAPSTEGRPKLGQSAGS